MIDVSLIIPCYNESEIIGDTLRAASDYLSGLGRSYEIVVGDDGSTDGTDRLVLAAGHADSRVRLVRSAHNRGKGAILTTALLEGRGRVLAFIDADLEIDVRTLGALLSAIDGGADIAIGSKVIHEAWRSRPLRRRIATRGYNLLVRILLGSPLRDHQAGIKAFRREPARELLESIDNPRWTWDTELLVAAQARRLLIAEVPVTTTYQRPSKVSLLRQPLEMASEVLRLYFAGVRTSRAPSARSRRTPSPSS
jgi:glycosyltransferase involved in cell wall biosynthesis